MSGHEGSEGRDLAKTNGIAHTCAPLPHPLTESTHVSHGAAKEAGVLRHDRDGATQRVQSERRRVHPIQEHAAPYCPTSTCPGAEGLEQPQEHEAEASRLREDAAAAQDTFRSTRGRCGR